MRALALLLGVALLTAGCMSLPANPEKMSPDQIREWTKDKSIAATCTTINSPYGRGIVIHVGMDKSVVKRGSVTVDDQCKVTITDEGAARP